MSNPQAVLSLNNGSQLTDYVILNPFTAFPKSAVTVELWLKTEATNDITPVSYEAPGAGNAFVMFRWAKNQQVIIHNARAYSDIASFNDGQWHHCAVTWNSETGQVKIYKDGHQEFATSDDKSIHKGKTISPDGSLVLGQEQDAVGGGFDPNQAFKGYLSDFRIWNRVRTAQEIEANMNFRLAGNEPELVAYWPLNEGEGNIANDKTGHGYHGTLVGGGATWEQSEIPIRQREISTQQANQQSLGTGLQDYAYWYRWKRSLPQSAKQKSFRRGRIWS
ncbi:LamG-like jellyroll fold domain-containing protein [Oxynema aestuarii]|jgi:cyanobactin cluster PatC/TenC/TruC protein|uniref:Cyanobactin biosynthesis PatC/TenC/TruC family protein n=1 Tax=Oxynema aestuarii AP17 TaxID=2064643 RepID=A0A6H1U4B1_9CYAN|nr:LamG-like jellyroll fold domain-containing protein [Oxynema aestuarii]QIZ73728.1 cyanobactin biosynthesis PatC/TenC/TruC family protein [Oxynema aestuarii AP17]